MYKVEFLDGTKTLLSANYIAENLFSQVDDDGYRQVWLDEIIDHRTNGSHVLQQDAYITTSSAPGEDGTQLRVGSY